MGNNGSMSTHGNIVLTHEINNTTMSLALTNLPNIMKNYKHVVNVATCSNISYPYMEKVLAFPTFADYLATKNDSAGVPSVVLGSNTNVQVTATGAAATSAPSSSAASKMTITASSSILAFLIFLISVIVI